MTVRVVSAAQASARERAALAAGIPSLQLMRRAVGRKIGVKAAGGIRDLTTVMAMVKAGATRIGASAGVQIMHTAHSGSLATDKSPQAQNSTD